jgi:hypothetical protein
MASGSQGEEADNAHTSANTGDNSGDSPIGVGVGANIKKATEAADICVIDSEDEK